jgi:hypothetical protein
MAALESDSIVITWDERLRQAATPGRPRDRTGRVLALGCGLGEHRGQQHPPRLVRRQLGQGEGLAQALGGDLGRQRAAPAGIGGHQDQLARDAGMPARS